MLALVLSVEVDPVSLLPFLFANRTLIFLGSLCWTKNSTFQSSLQLWEAMKHSSGQ